MSISVIVVATKDFFVAKSSDGWQMEAHTLSDLAKELHFHGVTAKAVRCQWQPGERMMTAGQQVALNAEIRRLECDEHTPPEIVHPEPTIHSDQRSILMSHH